VRRARPPSAGPVPGRAHDGPRLYSRNQLWAVIEDLQAEGATILLTTQYLEEADRLADDLVVIDHGQGLPPAHRCN
jgi:ABC-type Na+ transport system ATPase subunit NatA